jgi:succinate-semialdehyde dehydrogenase
MSLTVARAAMSVNPSTRTTIASYSFDTDATVAATLAQSQTWHWRGIALADRCLVLSHMAEHLDRDTASLAGLLTREMGKPISQARAEITKTGALRWYTEHGPAFLADQPNSVGADSIVRHEPLGPVLIDQDHLQSPG